MINVMKDMVYRVLDNVSLLKILKTVFTFPIFIFVFYACLIGLGVLCDNEYFNETLVNELKPSSSIGLYIHLLLMYFVVKIFFRVCRTGECKISFWEGSTIKEFQKIKNILYKSKQFFYNLWNMIFHKNFVYRVFGTGIMISFVVEIIFAIYIMLVTYIDFMGFILGFLI